ncbi:hypothetical protein CcaverHIS631_0702370 [Cutaneotrichosporon cavernicola]|nr:hypothetical protein CcaverHIS631_0702370 [Cutaneotrichosporon cavernicola]BEJ10201.1 hypothetical protein CcaverHIS641_0702360 [Cutaneotrichosporon cavernicola]
MSLKEEESLFSGLRRQVEQTREKHKEQMSSLEEDKERLQAELAALKREASETRVANATALEEQQRTLAATARLQADLEALQVAYSGAVDDQEHFQAGEAMAADEAQQLGPLRRALCFKDERIHELEEEVRRANDSAAAQVEMEQVVSAGLRERIGRLERRLRDKSSEDRARTASAESEHELAVMREQLERARRESQDARDALSKEVRTSTRERRRVETAEDALRDAREEARHIRESVDERDGLRLKIAVLEQEGNKTPSALQPVSPNTLKDAAPGGVPSPSKQNIRLQRELAHIQSQHAALKAAHDKLRVEYTHLSAKRDKDRQHFKDFHAVYMARKEAKRKRRETGTVLPSELSEAGATPPGPSSHQSSALGKSSPAIQAGDAGDDEVEPPAKRVRPSPPHGLEKKATELALDAPPPAVRRSRSESPAPDPASPPVPSLPGPRPEGPEPLLAVAPTKPRVSSTTAQASTPVISRTTHASTPARPGAAMSTPNARPGPSMSTPTLSTRTPTGLTRQASRVTPWLGGKVSQPRASTSSRKPARRDSFGSDDEAPSPAPSRHPLVRDRTGTSTMLRKTLQRSAQGTGKVESPSTDSLSKLDFEGLNAAERAAERKRLASLSAAERRQVYAPYKGNGRYVAPDDVKKTFADEFEINPARNEGVTHQYDAVVRNRDARKQMHGGDCECCRDYYDAVGDIPIFHGAPAWRDDPAERAVDIEDHQNRVSRHREVWRRPPTPPDYWKIAFPTTQEVESVNRRADEMTAAREAEVRREAAHKDSKWRKRV